VADAAWLAVFERENFGLLLIALRAPIASAGVRAAAPFAGWPPASRVGLRTRDRRDSAPLPELLTGEHGTAFWVHGVLPVNLVTAFTAILLLATSGLRTVTKCGCSS